MEKIILFLAAIFEITNSHAQAVKILTAGTPTSLRGLSAVDKNVVWASGSHGKIARTTDGGKTWQWLTPAGFGSADFRSIIAFDSSVAVIMAVDSPAYLLKTVNGGKDWKLVYRNDTKGIFLDAMSFSDNKHGVVIGDPINGKFFIAETSDGGDSWQDIPEKERAIADSGEACFASSNSNIVLLRNEEKIFVSGGRSSHLYINSFRKDLPIIQGKETTGANAVAVKSPRTIMIAGGDFDSRDTVSNNCFISNDYGETWRAPTTAPRGYRSCVQFAGGKTWVVCGLSGVDITRDNARTFTRISNQSFHVLRVSKQEKLIFLAGNNGKIAKIE